MCSAPAESRVTVALAVGIIVGTLALAVWFGSRQGLQGAEALVQTIDKHVVEAVANAAADLDSGKNDGFLVSLQEHAQRVVQDKLDEESEGGLQRMREGVQGLRKLTLKDISLRKFGTGAKAGMRPATILSKARGVFKILVTLYQIVSQMPSTLHITFPSSFRTFLDRVSFTRLVLKYLFYVQNNDQRCRAD
jgi:hypothetical protein